VHAVNRLKRKISTAQINFFLLKRVFRLWINIWSITFLLEKSYSSCHKMDAIESVESPFCRILRSVLRHLSGTLDERNVYVNRVQTIAATCPYISFSSNLIKMGDYDIPLLTIAINDNRSDRGIEVYQDMSKTLDPIYEMQVNATSINLEI
jgi:hypothetical protein